MSSGTSDSKPVLCVDLDGSLIKTDFLLEGLSYIITKKPWLLPLIPLWLLKGRAHLKLKLSQTAKINVETLPYNTQVLDYINHGKSSGQKIALTTATNTTQANLVAAYLGVFDEVIASEADTNLVGAKKLSAIKAKFPLFDYIGNEKRDRKIWREAENSIIVANSESQAEKIGGDIKFFKVIVNPVLKLKSISKALRTHQWVKNILLFVPLFLAHRWNESELVLKSIFAFFSFSFCASAFYIFNDLSDLESDRSNPTKKSRPFASGELSIGFGIIMMPILIAISLALDFQADSSFFNVLLVYAALTSLYSAYLKKIAVLDAVVLASFYALRLFAGSLAISVPISEWLLAFSMFLFLSLAFAKRFSELHSLKGRNEEKARGRGYVASDLEQVAQLGSSSGYISALVMALYISSEEVKKLYSNPEILWIICPILLYWVGRIWILAHRGHLHEDPIVFALKDKTSYLVGFLAILASILAI